MTDLMKRDLQMDGLYDSNHLCVILSQCDRDYDAKNYLRQNKSLSKLLESDIAKCGELWSLIQERKTTLAHIQEQISENEMRIKQLEPDNQSHLLEQDLRSRGLTLKRKRDDESIAICRHSKSARIFLYITNRASSFRLF